MIVDAIDLYKNLDRIKHKIHRYKYNIDILYKYLDKTKYSK